MMLIIRAIAGLTMMTMMMGAIRTAASRAPIASGSMTIGGGSEDRRRELDERQRQLDRDRRQLESDQRKLDDDY